MIYFGINDSGPQTLTLAPSFLKTKIFDFLQSCYPNYKNDEIETLISVLDKKEIKEMAKQAGLDDKEIKLLIK